MNVESQILEILKSVEHRDVPAYCRVNRRVAGACATEAGRTIIRLKHVEYQVEDVLDRLEAESGSVEYCLRDYSTTQRCRGDVRIYYTEYIESYLRAVAELITPHLDRLEARLSSLEKFVYAGEYPPETRFSPRINGIINLLIETEGGLYAWILLELIYPNYKALDRQINKQFLLDRPHLIPLILASFA